ncbi:SICAvar, type I (fragment), partial [Plasmodium knowlesi strain H]
NTFWEDNGAVKALWDELAQAMITNWNNGNGAECDSMTNASPSDKTACKYLHAGFKELYKDPAAPPGAADLLKNNPSFRQTMGCFLLHAYAKHMKEKATCLIDDGIEQAFRKAGSCTSSSNGKCVPCQWDKDDKWKECTIKTDGQGGTETKVENKLNTIIDKDKDEAVKKAAQAVNDLQLCEQVKCVTARWWKEVKKSGQANAGTVEWDEVWKELKTQLTHLGEGITTKKGEVESHCSGLKDETGKEACLLIAAGLKNLYDIQDNTTDPVKASFKRTMQCVLLNAIADKLQGDSFPCKDERNVEKGINEAFKKSINEKIENTSGGCEDGNMKCFMCPRFKIPEDCRIKTNHSTSSKDTKLKEEIDKVLTNDDNNGGGKKEMEQIWNQSIKDIC